MVRMNICVLPWLSGWWGQVRDASCITRERNLLEQPRRVNPLTSSGSMTFDRIVVPHDAAARPLHRRRDAVLDSRWNLPQRVGQAAVLEPVAGRRRGE